MTSHGVDRAPLAVAYGAGVDSTALLVGFVRRGIRPAYILFADTGGEKEETLSFRPVMEAYLRQAGFPGITVVRYVPRDFKHWPPYHTLEENCLTNGTLPSLAFGFKSCSQNRKRLPKPDCQCRPKVAACFALPPNPVRFALSRRRHSGAS